MRDSLSQCRLEIDILKDHASRGVSKNDFDAF